MLEKTSFIEISKKNKKQIVLFGSGNISKKTIRKIGRENVAFIADNSEDLQNTKFDGIAVLNPKKISKEYLLFIDISNRKIESYPVLNFMLSMEMIKIGILKL